jgi:hypothetical protein
MRGGGGSLFHLVIILGDYRNKTLTSGRIFGYKSKGKTSQEVAKVDGTAKSSPATGGTRRLNPPEAAKS